MKMGILCCKKIKIYLKQLIKYVINTHINKSKIAQSLFNELFPLKEENIYKL